MSEEAAAPERRFFRALEALRGLAACAVVLFHAGWSFHGRESFAVRNAWVCVDFFFVLSGFVLAHGYARRLGSAADARRFVLLRLARLYPLHFVLLQVWLLYELAKHVALARWGLALEGGAFARSDAAAYLANLTLTHSLNLLPGTTFNVPSWSISVELFTGLAFAALALVTRGRGLWLAAALASLGGLALLARLSAARGLAADHDYGLLRCGYGFFAGVLVHELWRRRGARPAGPWLGRAAEGAALLAVALGLRVGVVGAASAYLAVPLFACAIYVFAREPGPVSRALGAPQVVYVGTISYSIYLSHFLLVVGVKVGLRLGGWPLVDRVVQVPPLLGDALVVGSLAVTLAVSHLLFRWVEQPARARVRRWASGGEPPGSP